jgi:DNA-binding FadR family transcriptional regulator
MGIRSEPEPETKLEGRARVRQDGTERTYSKRSLHGQVAHEIGGRIVRGLLEPGKIIPNEAEFSRQLKVSRTVLREAIKILAAKGLLESRPKTGTRVRPRSHWNMLDPDVLAWQFAAVPEAEVIRHLFEVRQIIEPAAAAIAARRRGAEDLASIEAAFRDMAAASEESDARIDADLRFHQAILNATGNEFLSTLGALIETALAGSFRLSNARPGGYRRSLPAHERILKAIKQGDGKRASATMTKLLDQSVSDVLTVIPTEGPPENRAESAAGE